MLTPNAGNLLLPQIFPGIELPHPPAAVKPRIDVGTVGKRHSTLPSPCKEKCFV